MADNNYPQYGNLDLPIQQGSIQNPYTEFDVVIAPGAQEEIRFVFNYFRILTYIGTANDLRVRFGGSGVESVFSGAGLGFEAGLPFDRVFFRNTGGSPITLKVALAVGRISDDRLNVSGNVNVVQVSATGGVTQAAVTVGLTAVQLLTANSTRKGFTIQNLGSNDIYIGSSAVTDTNGIKITPGGSFNDNNNGNSYYGIALVAGQNVRVEEYA